jgi:hypothetical protein
MITVIVDGMKHSTLQHRLQWVKAHQDNKKPYEELNIWGHLNCDADNMAEKFQKLMDSGNVKALKEGFFMDSMEVGIEVNGVKVTSHILHQIQMHIQGSKQASQVSSINWKGIKSGYLSLRPLK